MSAFHLRDCAYWAEVAAATPRYVIDGLVHAGATIVSGRPSAQKSSLVGFLVAATAGGRDACLTRTVERHGRVLVVTTDAAENQKWGARMEQYGVAHDVKVGSYPGPEGGWDEVIDAVKREQPALFVLDNISRVIGDVDIRDSGAANRVLGLLDRVLGEDVPVLAVAHSSTGMGDKGGGKAPPKGPMGSTLYDAWARLTVHVTKTTERDLTVDTWGNDSPAMQLRLSSTWKESKGIGVPDYQIVTAGAKPDPRPSASKKVADWVEWIERHVIGNSDLVDASTQAEVADRLSASLGITMNQPRLSERKAAYQSATGRTLQFRSGVGWVGE